MHAKFLLTLRNVILNNEIRVTLIVLKSVNTKYHSNIVEPGNYYGPYKLYAF